MESVRSYLQEVERLDPNMIEGVLKPFYGGLATSNCTNSANLNKSYHFYCNAKLEQFLKYFDFYIRWNHLSVRNIPFSEYHSDDDIIDELQDDYVRKWFIDEMVAFTELLHLDNDQNFTTINPEIPRIMSALFGQYWNELWNLPNHDQRIEDLRQRFSRKNMVGLWNNTSPEIIKKVEVRFLNTMNLIEDTIFPFYRVLEERLNADTVLELVADYYTNDIADTLQELEPGIFTNIEPNEEELDAMIQEADNFFED